MWQKHHGVKINEDEDHELISEDEGRREIINYLLPWTHGPSWNYSHIIWEAVMVTKRPPGLSSSSGRVSKQVRRSPPEIEIATVAEQR